MNEKRELEMQFNYISAQIEEVNRQLGEMQVALQEVQDTLMAITEMEKKPKSTMVSVGAAAFAPAKIETNKILVPTGANVFSIKKPADAIKTIEERAVKLQGAITNIEKTLSQLLQIRQQIIQKTQQSEKMQ